MAVNPLYSRKRLILAKKEVSYGVDPVPTVAANAMLVRNLTVTPLNAQYAERAVVRPWFGHFQQFATAIHSVLEFEVELAGSGAAGTAPKWAPLLMGCGFAETVNIGVSVAYKPVSASFDSLTFYVNVDGVQHKMVGARGNVTLRLAVHEIPVLRFQFLGLYTAAADVALGTPTLTGWQTPLPVNNVNTNGFVLHAFNSEVLRSIEIDMGNQLVFRSLVGDVSGFEYIHMVDRQPRGQVVLQATRVADKNWWSAVQASDMGTMQVVHGLVGGNKVTIAPARCSLIEPTYSEEDGIMMLNLGLRLEPTAAGNDEIMITAL